MVGPGVKRVSLGLAVVLIGAACSASTGTDGVSTPPPSVATTTTAPTLVPGPTSVPPPAGRSVPDVDLSKHSVPLDEVLFDTFDGQFVALSDADPELILALRDAIAPVDEPRYGGPPAGAWLEPTDLVLGYENGDEAYAYPFKILDLHELVNDVLGDVPVLVSYCPLCRSGVVYDRRVGDQLLDFGNTSALYESDLVMVDRQTGSYWWQVAGEAIVGTLTGARLTPLPSRVDTWAGWLESNPDTMVLEPPRGSSDFYAFDRFGTYEQLLDAGGFAFPVNRLDDRLGVSELVIGVEVGEARRAYSSESLGVAAVNDVLAGTELVVFTNGSAGGAVFGRQLEGGLLTFTVEDGRYRDEGTGSVWDLSGRAVAGPLEGATLEPWPSRTSFWFAYAGAFPDTEVYQPDG